MSVWGSDEETTLAAVDRTAPTPKKPAKFSAWSAIPRGVAEAGAQVAASVSDVIGGYGQVMGAYPEAMGVIPTGKQKAQADKARQKLLADGVDMNSPMGESVRDFGRELRPDPVDASTAEQVLYGFARGAAKVVGGAVLAGPAGIVAAGAEEGMSAADDLRRQGVDFNTRAGAGLVQGAGLALAALPAAGATLKSTAALYAAGGPGGYVAQQALTREILQRNGYAQQAAGFDPFDPVGLAVSALVPLPFAALGLRASRQAKAVQAAEQFRAGPVPSEPTAIARAVDEAMPQDVVDAALVSHARQAREAANLRPDDLRAAAQHDAAMAKAEQQFNAGERVSVADVAPRVISAAEREANFRAWFGDSKVVDADGKPLRLYHGTTGSFDSFDLGRAGSVGENFGRAIFLTSDPGVAASYTARWSMSPEFAVAREAEDRALSAWGKAVVAHGKDSPEVKAAEAEKEAAVAARRQIADQIDAMQRPIEGANLMPSYVTLKNPLVVDGNGGYFFRIYKEAFDAARAGGHDGIAFRNVIDSANVSNQRPADVFVAFSPEQVKSAIGNSGRFDPNSASLTDPLSDFAAGMRALQEARADAAPAPQAPNPQAATPARSAGAAEPAAGAAPAGRPAPEVAADGLTPGGKAEAMAAPSRVDALLADNPDMLVMLDGMEAPMKLGDFLAAAKAEADEMLADAPLMQVAAECALVNGV
jgi:hypothetical protein